MVYCLGEFPTRLNQINPFLGTDGQENIRPSNPALIVARSLAQTIRRGQRYRGRRRGIDDAASGAEHSCFAQFSRVIWGFSNESALVIITTGSIQSLS